MRTFRPGGARVVAYAVAVIMLVITAVIAYALPDEIYFTTAETVTLWIFILAVLALLHGVGRSYVRATDEGLEVLNGYRRHRVQWSDIEGFAMNTGAPWPTLVTKDDERVMLFAIQGSDGRYAREAVAYLRGRLG
ncbi:PH domain-containing protein [Aeromicrobium sp. SMF47]|uniref:PH domain-containing protein n=1 Tax=Aeromicrobium yanjiei TaxID=2662028 RepID=A0A5Q2MIT5_9ACTN|nr:MULTISPECIES: PH domain-containing protein [Aeromicrobium]MRJ77193.1 PH domain-containing protein [Aeromicrobium yanjiei]MRK01560.1 PH domain-containing protein [Aeromicrobium sp. S22]QGG41671.1 PH domain-containing protein [Aeromicrobium yanjiei]